MKINFGDLFNSFRGANSEKIKEPTEEFVYSFCQDIFRGMKKIPVFSGSVQNEGIVGYLPNYLEDEEINKINEKYLEKKGIRYFLNKEDCLTMVRCGDAGKIFYRSKKDYPIFTLTTSIFAFFVKSKEEVKKIKEEYSEYEGINLRWFSLKFNPLFNNLVKGDGLSTIPLSIIDNVELEIPNLKEQEEELSNYEEMYNLFVKLEKVINKIQKVKEKHIEGELSGDEIPAKDIFESISGNSGLTEEYIYSRIDIKDNSQRYKVLSSSTIDRTSLGEVKKGMLLNGRELKTFEDKEGLLVVRNGDAGRIIFLDKGFYTLNDHAYILYLNKNFENKIKLKWIMYQYQSLFLEFSSNSDNGTWNKTNFMKQAKIKIIPEKEQEAVIKSYEKLENLEKSVSVVLDRINNLFSKELVVGTTPAP